MDAINGRKRRTPAQMTRRHLVAMVGIFAGAVAASGTTALARRSGSEGGDQHCFLKGTQVWTPDGERRIEDLRINDLVITRSGEPKPN